MLRASSRATLWTVEGLALSLDLQHIHAAVVAAIGAHMMWQAHLVARRALHELDRMQGIMSAAAMGAPM